MSRIGLDGAPGMKDIGCMSKDRPVAIERRGNGGRQRIATGNCEAEYQGRQTNTGETEAHPVERINSRAAFTFGM